MAGRLERVRGWVLLVWPMLASAAAVAVMVAMGTVVLAALERDHEAEERDRRAEALATDVRAIAIEAREASKTNRDILEQLRPCNADSPPTLPSCVRLADSNRRVADALAAIQHQHDQVLARLEALLARPTPDR